MKKIENFIDGFARFQQHYFEKHPELYRGLCQGQRPSTLLIGCCDSRVDPAMLLGCDPGDIFTIRNMANLVPPPDRDNGPQGVLAAIQFAVEDLQVERIIVLGHSQCGGIRALMQGRAASDKPVDFVRDWMGVAESARECVLRQLPDASEEEHHRACEQASILISLQNLQRMDGVRRRMEEGSLSLHGWYFDLASGNLLAYSPRADAFLPIFCTT
ncbi:carbonic anhydrase [Parapusillimonas granuli]|uniref:Carbonic anhydrase n=1 Tax=Parapusillimonas granuli TaxID=380911 RepID=A0A853FYP9_9BURK|nr:carbonic anhydrase [Parapusillimonas granuli]MBB5214877.1 carbonic anhydrase [Parapusillimonas granuli]MEB2399927.1 carbonic anhydrase [Alcaligenaceae bacterium]NYT49199.1 carbonic anhydrase [Parapusillimonas granuli]